MSAAAVTHEGFMNGSRMILPRVGGGVGVRGGWRSSIQDQVVNLTVGARGLDLVSE